MKNGRIKKFKNLADIAIGNALIAFAVAAFVSSSGLIMGGCTGIGLILVHYLGISLSLAVLGINVLLYVLGSVFLGKSFAIQTLVSTFLYPLFLHLFQSVSFLQSISTEPILCAVIGGCLLGASVGIIDRTGGSTGGTDVIALILNKYTHISVGAMLYVIDGCILLGQALFSDVNQVLYGIVFLLCQIVTLNKLMLAGKTQIQFLIISDQYEAIRKNLLMVQDVGATLLEIEKGMTGVQSKGILCITSRRSVHRITQIIDQVDPKAFVTIHEVNEVRGTGFTSDRVKWKNCAT